jgi:hypothetical protein
MSIYDGLGVDPKAQEIKNKLVNRAFSKLPQPKITGLKLKADVSLGGMTLNTIDSSGVVWVCTDIEGWWGQPEVEFPEFNRGWGDGSYDARGRWTARDMVLKGSFFTQDPSQVAEARNKLITSTSLVYLGDWLVVRETKSIYVTDISEDNNTITVPSHGLTVNSLITYQSVGVPIGGLIPEKNYYVKTVPTANTFTLSLSQGGLTVDITPVFEQGVTHSFAVSEGKTSYVRLSGKPDIETVDARGRTDFSIGLRAADPIKYEIVGNNFEAGRTVTVSGSATIVNTGNTRVPVYIRVSGAATATAQITNTTTSQTIGFAKVKTSGPVLEIDTYNREVLLDTSGTITNGRQFIKTLADWIYLEPGVNSFTSSGATFVVEYRSGWIG